MSVKPVPEGHHSVTPYLVVADAARLIEFLKQVWMRTHGASVFGLPDLAAWADGHHEGHKWFAVFDNMLRYMLDSGAKIEAGHTGQIDEEAYLRFRKPTCDEPTDSDDGELLIVDLIDKSEINRRTRD